VAVTVTDPDKKHTTTVEHEPADRAKLLQLPVIRQVVLAHEMNHPPEGTL
jgi:hypothetical protein